MSYQCEHGRQCKSRCSECLGHPVNQNKCSRCKKSYIPPINDPLQTCLECRKQNCEHGYKSKKDCKSCKNESNNKYKCEHNKKPNRCNICNPHIICEHYILKENCIKCNPQILCNHNIKKSYCKICSPNTKSYCVQCKLFRVNKKTNYLCSYCNPDKPKRQKTKEIRVKTFLEENNYTFVYNKKCNLDNSCQTYYPDFLIDCNTFLLIIECDEDGHKNYDKFCEKIRENNIRFALGLPCVFIRYNPDKKNISIKIKEKVLKSYIDYISKENCNNEVCYLFY